MADITLSFDGTAIQTQTISGSAVRMQKVSEEGGGGGGDPLTVDATLNSQTVTLTVYEDTTGDGTPDNTETVTVLDGNNTYAVSNLALATGNDYWLDIDFSTSNVEQTAEINSIELTV